MAITVQTGRTKDKARLEELFKHPSLFDKAAFESLITRFGLTERWEETKRWLQMTT